MAAEKALPIPEVKLTDENYEYWRKQWMITLEAHAEAGQEVKTETYIHQPKPMQGRPYREQRHLDGQVVWVEREYTQAEIRTILPT